MEFAAAALTTVAETVGTAVGSVGTAAAETFGVGAAAGKGAAAAPGLLSSLGQTSTWLNILQGGATVASVLSTLRSGEVDAAGKLQQAGDAQTKAKLEEVKGLERRASLRKNLIAAIADRDVAAAASGVDPSFGTPTIAKRQATEDTERALSLDQDTENIRKAQLLRRADSLRWQAGEIRRGKLAQAAGIGLQGGLSMLRRG